MYRLQPQAQPPHHLRLLQKDKPDNARFLAEHYGENGAGFYLNGKKYALWYNAEGIRIAEGESARRSSAALIPWEQAAARIRELLDLGRYMPQSELDQVDRYEVNALADRLLLMFRDIEDEDKRFFPRCGPSMINQAGSRRRQKKLLGF